MKARKDTNEKLDFHAELNHRAKMESLHAEGMRLRRELRRLGADPALILLAAQERRRRPEHN
jgi:hypothetical protein